MAVIKNLKVGLKPGNFLKKWEIRVNIREQN